MKFYSFRKIRERGDCIQDAKAVLDFTLNCKSIKEEFEG